MARFVAWVVTIRVTGVATIGAAGQGTLAMGAVVVVVVVITTLKARLVAWVVTIRVTGVATIGAADQGTLAMGAVVVVVVVNTGVTIVEATAVETWHLF